MTALTHIRWPDITKDLSRFDSSLEELRPHLKDADAAVGYVLPEGSLDLASLKLLAWMHVGCDELPLARMKEMSIQVTNIRAATRSL